MDNDDKLIQISMNIILYAGNARNAIREIGKRISNDQLDGIEDLLQQANEEYIKAHKVQTEIIQSEARGEVYTVNILFSHAQDTLMTTQSELFMIETLYNYIKLKKEEETV